MHLIELSKAVDLARQEVADNDKDDAALVRLIDAEEAYRKARKLGR